MIASYCRSQIYMQATQGAQYVIHVTSFNKTPPPSEWRTSQIYGDNTGHEIRSASTMCQAIIHYSIPPSEKVHLGIPWFRTGRTSEMQRTREIGIQCWCVDAEGTFRDPLVGLTHLISDWQYPSQVPTAHLKFTLFIIDSHCSSQVHTVHLRFTLFISCSHISSFHLRFSLVRFTLPRVL